MEKTSQSSNPELSSLYRAKKRVKRGSSLLDKASCYFEREIAYKYSYKIIKFIDVKGIRFVIAEKDGMRYAISLLIINLENDSPVALNYFIQLTKMVSVSYKCDLAGSAYIYFI